MYKTTTNSLKCGTFVRQHFCRASQLQKHCIIIMSHDNDANSVITS
nr:MAG TPA: hypothetical protein [Caudoviricetes sp.]